MSDLREYIYIYMKGFEHRNQVLNRVPEILKKDRVPRKTETLIWDYKVDLKSHRSRL